MDIVREIALLSCGDCWAWGFRDGAIDVAGLETGPAEGMDVCICDGSDGDGRSKDEMLVMLLPVREGANDEAYELCRRLDAVEETEP